MLVNLILACCHVTQRGITVPSFILAPTSKKWRSCKIWWTTTTTTTTNTISATTTANTKNLRCWRKWRFTCDAFSESIDGEASQYGWRFNCYRMGPKRHPDVAVDSVVGIRRKCSKDRSYRHLKFQIVYFVHFVDIFYLLICRAKCPTFQFFDRCLTILSIFVDQNGWHQNL